MDDYESLSHTKWECKYHVVFIAKYRRKTLYGELRKHLGEVLRGGREAASKDAASKSALADLDIKTWRIGQARFRMRLTRRPSRLASLAPQRM